MDNLLQLLKCFMRMSVIPQPPSPLRICRATSDRFEESDAMEAAIQQVEQPYAEEGEHVKDLHNAAATCTHTEREAPHLAVPHKYPQPAELPRQLSWLCLTTHTNQGKASQPMLYVWRTRPSSLSMYVQVVT